MFTPQPNTIRETLFAAFLEIFLGDEEVGVGHNAQPAKMVPLPSFADGELSFRISTRIHTQTEPAGTQILDRTKRCLPKGKAQLREHILSSGLWDLDVDYWVKFENTDNEAKCWHWAPPPGGKFVVCTMKSNRRDWEQWGDVVNRL
jgi:hypothetical protein